MAKKVLNLNVKLEPGTDRTLVATWTFNSSIKNTTASANGIKVGDFVGVKSGATWYNGASIPGFVFNDEWKVIQINGDRVVLGKNKSGSNDIQSPIKASNLTGGSGSSTTTTIDTLDHYITTWFYDSGGGWREGSHNDNYGNYTYSTYDPPEEAVRVTFHIIPVSKTRKVNDKDTPYWSGALSVSNIFYMSALPPEVPSTPTVEVIDRVLLASLENISDARTDQIQFQVYKGVDVYRTATANVLAAMTSARFDLSVGGSYRVRARAINKVTNSGLLYSDWSDFTSAVKTNPGKPGNIKRIRAYSSTSVYLEWGESDAAETYEIEYTTNPDYFDISDETTSVTGIEHTEYIVTGLETGDEYFFRVRGVNDQGESEWTKIVSCTIGEPPSAPTTWSSSTTVIVGEVLNLYWVHNAKDGSKEHAAQIEINGKATTINNPTADDDEAEETTKYYSVNTTAYREGTTIKWRVRTSGVTQKWGDWSIMRTVTIYARPTLALNITNQNGNNISTITSFPFFIKGLAGPNTQEPIGYHVSITPNTGYETVNHLGEMVVINQDQEIFSQYIDTNDALLLEISASNIDLQSGVTYTVTVKASMNSGLTAEASEEIDVSWTDEQVPLDAEIAYDRDSFVAYITPYSRDEETGKATPNLNLAVYRREFDGTFTEIATGLDSTKNTAVTDPHPALDYARYRIVATSTTTGAVTYYDPPGYPVGDDVPVIIQWDEVWRDFDVSNIDPPAVPTWSGSMLKLPYNIDVSDNNTPSVTTVNYAGRTYPVSYYGTSIESTSTWNVDIAADDKDTIYALRRLAIWRGDVYVREPSGSGYWATINVSFSKTHQELTIPVTLDITRVEGGM